MDIDILKSAREQYMKYINEVARPATVKELDALMIRIQKNLTTSKLERRYTVAITQDDVGERACDEFADLFSQSFPNYGVDYTHDIFSRLSGTGKCFINVYTDHTSPDMEQIKEAYSRPLTQSFFPKDEDHCQEIKTMFLLGGKSMWNTDVKISFIQKRNMLQVISEHIPRKRSFWDYAMWVITLGYYY